MANIITITPGSYTPAAESALNALASVINAAWNLGNDKMNDLAAKIDAITDEATGWLSTQAAPAITGDKPTFLIVNEAQAFGRLRHHIHHPGSRRQATDEYEQSQTGFALRQRQ